LATTTSTAATTTTTTAAITSPPTKYPLTAEPTNYPTSSPSKSPIFNPSVSPSLPPTSSAPIQEPSRSPSTSPSNNPSSLPSRSPSISPTSMPSRNPSIPPSNSPTISPSQKPTIVSNIACETDDDCDLCSTCNSSKLCAPPSYGCLCDSNCPSDRPKCYHVGNVLGSCGCDSNDQCNGIGETCDYSCVIADSPKSCETPESRNKDCEGLNGPGYVCSAGSTRCTNPPSPTPLPTPRPVRSREIFY
jgi:hypothetical protein